MTMTHPGSPTPEQTTKLTHDQRTERERDDFLRRLALEQAVKLTAAQHIAEPGNYATELAPRFYAFLIGSTKPDGEDQA